MEEKDSRSKEQKEADFKEELKQVQEIARQLKRSLKMRSKSQLIDIIIAYSSDLQEMQGAAQQLFEENKELKSKLAITDKEEVNE